MKKKRIFLRRILVFSLCLVLFFCVVPDSRLTLPVSADAAAIAESRQELKLMEESLAVLKENSEAASEAYEAALRDYESAELDIEKAYTVKAALDRDIAALEKKISSTQALLAVYNEQIRRGAAAIEEKETEITERREAFLHRMRYNYEDSFVSYLEIILESDSFSDFLYHVDVVASLLDYDKRVLESLDQAKKDLVSLQTSYQTMQYKAQETLDTLSASMPELEEKRQRNTELLAELDRKLLELKNKKDATEEEKARFEAEVAKQEQRIAQEEAALEQKIREEQERLRLERERAEAERRAREEEERRKREEEERLRREEEERRRREEEERAGQEGTEDDPSPIAEPPETDAPAESEEPKTEMPPDDGTYIWPVETSHSVISSPFGYRTSPITGRAELHNGIDIPAPYGSDIYASRAGTVIIAGEHYSYGNYVVIDHGNGVSTLYAHNSKLLVSAGDIVAQGDVIAYCGSTGNSQGNHCHFSVRVDGSPVQPLDYVSIP